MTEIKINLSFPLDDDSFFRRECPFCHKQFKILLRKDELSDLVQKAIDSFMIDPKKEASHLDESEHSATEFICPYCGQQAPNDSWFTQEQLAYAGIVVKNIMAKKINQELIRPLKTGFGKSSNGLFSLRFEGKEMKQQEPWISPEVNDMNTFELPCCERKIKIESDWTGRVHCFLCGFPHKYKNI